MRKAMLQHFNDAAGFNNNNNNNNNVAYAPLAATPDSALASDSSSSSSSMEEANKQVHRAEVMARIAAKHALNAAAPAPAASAELAHRASAATSTDGSTAVARPEVLVASDGVEQPCIVGPCAKPAGRTRLFDGRSGAKQDTTPEKHAAATSREASADVQAKKQAKSRISAKHAREAGGSSSSSAVGSSLRAREAQKMLEQEVASSSSSAPLDTEANNSERDQLGSNSAQQIQGGSPKWGQAWSSSAKEAGLEGHGVQQGGRGSQVRAGGFGNLHLSMGGGYPESSTGGGGGGTGGRGYAGNLRGARSLGMPQQLGMAMGGGGGGRGGMRSEGGYGGGAASSSGVYTGDSVQDHLFDIATKGSSARAYLSRRGGVRHFRGRPSLGEPLPLLRWRPRLLMTSMIAVRTPSTTTCLT